MKTSSAKAKGRRCSSELRDMMLKGFPELEPGDIVITSSGETGPDLKLSPKAMKRIPLNIECKNVEKINIWAAMKQAVSHFGIGFPAVFYKRNRTEMYVSMRAGDLLWLISKSESEYVYQYSTEPPMDE